MDQPAQEEEEEQRQGSRRVGDVFIDPEKIGKVVNQGEKKDKGQSSPLRACGGEKKYCQEHGKKDKLEGGHQGHILQVKKIEEDGIKKSEEEKKRPDSGFIGHGCCDSIPKPAWFQLP